MHDHILYVLYYIVLSRVVVYPLLAVSLLALWSFWRQKPDAQVMLSLMAFPGFGILLAPMLVYGLWAVYLQGFVSLGMEIPLYSLVILALLTYAPEVTLFSAFLATPTFLLLAFHGFLTRKLKRLEAKFEQG